MDIKTIEAVFAAIIGTLSINIPYISHVINPISSMIIVGKERSLVCFVLIAFSECFQIIVFEV
jgi:hypothetical protein